MFANCCKPNRADIVEEGKEEAMSHSNIFPTFTIKDKAAAPGQRPIQAAAAGFFFLLGG